MRDSWKVGRILVHMRTMYVKRATANKNETPISPGIAMFPTSSSACRVADMFRGQNLSTSVENVDVKDECSPKYDMGANAPLYVLTANPRFG